MFITAQVFEGLNHLKNCGLNHRDMKPDNLMMTDEKKLDNLET